VKASRTGRVSMSARPPVSSPKVLNKFCSNFILEACMEGNREGLLLVFLILILHEAQIYVCVCGFYRKRLIVKNIHCTK
jgi:hypothetical protein